MQLICSWRRTPSVADRISRLTESENLEEAACAALKYLEELKRQYLRVVEEKLLSVIEFEYGIIDEIPRNSHFPQRIGEKAMHSIKLCSHVGAEATA